MDNTPPPPPPPLRERLREIALAFCYSGCGDNEREALITFLQTNDCRPLLSNARDTDDNDLIDAFTSAARENQVTVLQIFLDQGMNVNVNNTTNPMPPLMLASLFNHKESVRLLLDHNANPDIQDKYGYTALMYASEYDLDGIVEMLLENNANPDIQNRQGNTALMRANESSEKICLLLLNHGADSDLRNNNGQTALDLAVSDEVREILRNHVTVGYVLK